MRSPRPVIIAAFGGQHMNRAIRLFALLFLVASPVLAQPPAPLLVDAGWLAQHLSDRDLVLLHIGGKAEYDAGHIAGARYITQEDVARPHDMARGDLMLELPPLEELRAKVASFGISDNSRIVVYFGRTGDVQSSTRIIFTLDYLGLGDRTSLLNGGLPAWIRAGQPTTASVPAAARGTLSVRPAKPVVVDAEFVKSIASRPNTRLVDARAAVFYSGIEPTMNGAKGHIPGAVNIPFSKITDDNMLVDRERVAALFAASGIKPGDTVVAYCHVGQQGTAVVFGARLLGYTVMLYDGSFQDWAMNKRGPVEK
jgi:thiosulfate/3-mercaptopyruvate sulfurtransferase